MAKGPGFIGGAVKGAVLSLAVLAAVSVILPPPEDPRRVTPQDRLEVPAGSEFARPPVEGPTRLPQAGADAPEASAPASRPQPAPAAGPASTDPADTAPGSRPVVPEAPVPAPQPEPEPATPPVTPPPAAQTEPAPPQPLGLPTGRLEVPRLQMNESRLPQLPRDAPAAPAADSPATADAADPDPGDTGGAGPAPVAPGGPSLPGVAVEDAAPALPSGAPDAPVPFRPRSAAGDGAAQAPAAAALARNALPFAPDGRPLLAILLIDAGAEAAAPEVLATFPFPVSFAIDPAAPGAADRAAALRAAGFEVLARLPGGTASLPPDPSPADVETALESHFATLPMAVGLLAEAPSPLVEPGAAARQALAYLAGSGHGLVLASGRSGSLLQAAGRAGVAAAPVARTLDAGAASGPALKRMLDRAAFAARNEGPAIVLGQGTPAVVRALFEWAATGEAATVALAPVSAVLRAAR